MHPNPIDIPGFRRNQWRNALDPVRHPEHMDYFVTVDDTCTAYTEFQEAFETASWVLDGALVVAAGIEQSGKTALLKRCARWLHDHMPDYAVRMVDLTDISVEPQLSTANRMGQVCTRLVNYLIQKGLVVDEHLKSLPPDPAVVIPYLPGAIQEGVVLVVILPPSDDLVGELVQYAKLIPERVMLLGETSYVDRIKEALDDPGIVRISPLLLEVGLLRAGDADRFYAARRERHPADADVPKPAADTMRKLIEAKGMTIGELQRLLYAVYADVQTHQPPAVSEVTYEYITDFNFRNPGGRR